MKKLYCILIMSILVLTACTNNINNANQDINDVKDNTSYSSVKAYISRIETRLLMDEIQDKPISERIINSEGKVNHNNVDVRNISEFSNVDLTVTDNKLNGTITHRNNIFKVIDNVPYKQ